MILSAYRLSLIVILVLLQIPTVCLGKESINQNTVSVIFRYDDISFVSNNDIEIKIIEAFRLNNASFTIGVIPSVSNSDILEEANKYNILFEKEKQQFLKKNHEEGIVDIALHGYTHKDNKYPNKSEFAGLNIKNQIQRLSLGKGILEKIINAPVRIFIPPFNSYDINTLKALHHLKFECISGSKTGPVLNGNKLKYLPGTCNIGEVRTAVKIALSTNEIYPIITVVFHEYDFVEIDNHRGIISYEEFKELLNWIKNLEQVRLITISDAIRENINLSAEKYSLNKKKEYLNKLLPKILQEKDNLTIYKYLPTLKNTIFKLTGFYLATVLLSLLISYLIGNHLYDKHYKIISKSIYVSLIFCISLVIYTLHDLKVHFNGLLVIVIVTGVTIGLSMLPIRFKKIT